MRRWWVMVVIGSMLLFSISSATLANPVQVIKNIRVLSQEIRIFIDGKQLITQADPVILADQGVTLVPLRALAEALNKTVTWDPATFTIHVSSGIPSPPPLALPRYDLVESLKVLRNLGPFYQQPKKPFYIAGRPFEHGIGVMVDRGVTAETVLDLNGKYTWARGFIGVEDATKNSAGAFRLEIYAEDARELYTSHIIRPAQYPFQFHLPALDGVRRITLRVIWLEGSVLGEGSAVIAALGDFRFFHK